MANLCELTVELNPTAPFDWAKSLAFVGEFMPTRDEQQVSEQRLAKAIRIDGLTVVFVMMSVGTIETPQLKVRCFSHEPLSIEQVTLLEDRLGFYLSLYDELLPFYQLAQADPRFYAFIQQRAYGYHHVKFLTPFENAVWAILSQRTPRETAHHTKQQLMMQYGGKLTVHGQEYVAFPAPADCLGSDRTTLTEIVGNARKAEYLEALIRAFVTVDEHWMRSAPYADAEAWLRQIKGIGEWSANFVLLRGFGRMDSVVITSGDTPFNREFLRSAQAVYGAIPLDELQVLAQHYADYQGYWAHYMRAFS